MLNWFGVKFGKYIVIGVIGFITFVFVFYGIFNPRSTRGLHEGAVAGTVNGDPIPIADFQRALNQRMEFFKSMMGGGNLTEEQLKAFRLREGVFQELVKKRLLMQEAERRGMVPSDEEIRDKIREIPAFQANGQFDLGTYKRTLEANQYSPGGFERLMREDISVQKWEQFFQDRVLVSDDEVRRQFLISEDKRNIKYVLLTSEAAKKDVKVEPAEIQKFLADQTRANLAKNQFESKKDREFKGKTFDQVKEQLARDLIASDKVEEIRKINENLAAQILPLMAPDKKNDAKIDTILKPYNVTVKSTGWVNRQTQHLPGIGEARDLMTDAFAAKSPIDPAQGGKAKKYLSAGWVLVAEIEESQTPDLAKIDAQRADILKQITTRKERDIYDNWVRKLAEKAKIDANPSVINGGADES